MKKQRGIEEALSGTVLRGGEAISNKLAYAFGKAAGLGPKVLARGLDFRSGPVFQNPENFRIVRSLRTWRVFEFQNLECTNVEISSICE